MGLRGVKTKALLNGRNPANDVRAISPTCLAQQFNHDNHDEELPLKEIPCTPKIAQCTCDSAFVQPESLKTERLPAQTIRVFAHSGDHVCVTPHVLATMVLGMALPVRALGGAAISRGLGSPRR